MGRPQEDLFQSGELMGKRVKGDDSNTRCDTQNDIRKRLDDDL